MLHIDYFQHQSPHQHQSQHQHQSPHLSHFQQSPHQNQYTKRRCVDNGEFERPQQPEEHQLSRKHDIADIQAVVVTNHPFQQVINQKFSEWRTNKISFPINIDRWTSRACWSKKVMAIMVVVSSIRDSKAPFLDSLWHNLIGGFIRIESKVRERIVIDQTGYSDQYPNNRMWLIRGKAQPCTVLDKSAATYQTFLAQAREQQIIGQVHHYKTLIGALVQFHAKCTQVIQKEEQIVHQDWLKELRTILNSASIVVLDQFRNN